MKRERNRALPVGVDFWDFDCRFGATEQNAVVAHPAELIGLIDAAAKEGGTQFYIEILAKHGCASRATRRQAPRSPTFWKSKGGASTLSEPIHRARGK